MIGMILNDAFHPHEENMILKTIIRWIRKIKYGLVKYLQLNVGE
ncbi:hypothetical protein SAMN02982990_04164 [Photorhabdus luminescens]|uniref:Uncharacterized protein n=1 Tax=Photorhabdus luminescens TaxID=29488 RepID=A0A1G5RG54_PHOLU|nr:hypothetical protein SAMN02982990_04164 [Photorhabdus luminescens]